MNLLLGMLLLFNVEMVGLRGTISVTVENVKYQSLLKRWVTNPSLDPPVLPNDLIYIFPYPNPPPLLA